MFPKLLTEHILEHNRAEMPNIFEWRQERRMDILSRHDMEVIADSAHDAICRVCTDGCIIPTSQAAYLEQGFQRGWNFQDARCHIS